MPTTTSVIGHNSIRVELVTSMDQLREVFAIRAVCYVEDKRTVLPFNHAFDDNDLQSTHMVAYLGDEPIGALRIRWFSDFAKIERTGFRPSYRSPRYLQAAAPFVFGHIAKKGYSKVITHAEPEYARVWRTFLGFKNVDKPKCVYSVGEYVELVKFLDVPSDAITAETSIRTLFRVEGAWDVPSKLDLASGVTR
jgi:hypothetical protein